MNRTKKTPSENVAKSFIAMIHLHSYKTSRSIRQGTHTHSQPSQSRNKENFHSVISSSAKTNVQIHFHRTRYHAHRTAFCWPICSNRCYVKCLAWTSFHRPMFRCGVAFFYSSCFNHSHLTFAPRSLHRFSWNRTQNDNSFSKTTRNSYEYFKQ